jgi:glycerophosphoryl diester phosphodiesterase
MPSRDFPGPSRKEGTARRGARAPRRVLNIAHRGAAGHAPEHTIAAYDLALEMGADYIEHDLHLTSDGALVAIHDASLYRTTGRTDMVRDTTLDELRVLDAGSWFNDAHRERARPEYVGLRVPAMAEIFERYGTSIKYYIEVKDSHLTPGAEQTFVELLDAAGLMEHAVDGGVLVQSFDPDSLARFRHIEPDLVLIRLFSLIQNKESMLGEMGDVATYAAGIGPDKFNVDEQLLTGAHAHGLDVHPFTVDEEGEMSALLAAGVDGIFTNYPDRLTALLGR